MRSNNFVQKIVCFVLAIILAFVTAGCAQEETTPKKKKIIKKKVVKVIVQQEENTLDSTVDIVVDDDEEINVEYVRRSLYEEENDKEYVESYEPQYDTEKIVFNIDSNYSIVYSDDVMYARTYALSLKKYFKENGLELDVKEESNVSASQKMILVGNTKFYKSSLKENEFKVLISGDNIVFSGSHFMMVENAVDWFISLKFEKGKVNLVSGKVEDFVSSVTTTRGTYDLVWGDEFSGTTLDDNKWIQNTSRLHVYPSTLKTQTLKECFDVSDGLLKMSAIKYYDDEYPDYKYATGRGVFTEDRMSYALGYTEVRVRYPFVRGAHANVWLDGRDPFGEPNNDEYFTEINLSECFASKDTLVPNLHKWYWDGRHAQYNQNARHANKYIFEDTTNLINEYHLIGFEWTTEEIIMSVDGNEYMTFDYDYNFDDRSSMDVFKKHPLEIAISYGLVTEDNKNWAGQTNMLINDKDLPFHMYVDYIRIYQNKSENGSKLYVRDENGNAVAMH